MNGILLVMLWNKLPRLRVFLTILVVFKIYKSCKNMRKNMTVKKMYFIKILYIRIDSDNIIQQKKLKEKNIYCL